MHFLKLAGVVLPLTAAAAAEALNNSSSASIPESITYCRKDLPSSCMKITTEAACMVFERFGNVKDNHMFWYCQSGGEAKAKRPNTKSTVKLSRADKVFLHSAKKNGPDHETDKPLVKRSKDATDTITVAVCPTNTVTVTSMSCSSSAPFPPSSGSVSYGSVAVPYTQPPYVPPPVLPSIVPFPAPSNQTMGFATPSGTGYAHHPTPGRMPNGASASSLSLTAALMTFVLVAVLM